LGLEGALVDQEVMHDKAPEGPHCDADCAPRINVRTVSEVVTQEVSLETPAVKTAAFRRSIRAPTLGVGGPVAIRLSLRSYYSTIYGSLDRRLSLHTPLPDNREENDGAQSERTTVNVLKRFTLRYSL
jgi:hypothetical protein